MSIEDRRPPENAVSVLKTVCCSFRCHSLQKSMSRYNNNNRHFHFWAAFAKLPDKSGNDLM